MTEVLFILVAMIVAYVSPNPPFKSTLLMYNIALTECGTKPHYSRTSIEHFIKHYFFTLTSSTCFTCRHH